MKKSSISILLLMLVMIFAISAVSAADTNDSSDSVVQAVDETSIDEVDSQAVDDALTANDNADVLTAGEGNFTELQTKVNSGTVLMDKNYARLDGENDISITGSVTIMGDNQYIIDAKNLGRIFNVASGGSLYLMGVTLKNGNAAEGGAIYNDGGYVMVSGCKVLDNTAVEKGGAIYSENGRLQVLSSTLDGNSITDQTDDHNGGAAIYCNGGTTLIDSSFITNNMKTIAHSQGTDAYAGSQISAAVTVIDNELTVTKSTFENNSGRDGGAISTNEGKLTVSDSTFVDNFAFFGGAISNTADATITKSTFKGNKARGTGYGITDVSNGGAIYNSALDILITYCNFTDNTASIGGAIYSGNAQIINCNFTDNDASGEYSESYNGNPNNYGGFGDAIFTDGTSSISKSNFENNGVRVSDSEIVGSSFDNSVIEVDHGSLAIAGNTYANADYDISGTNTSDVYLNASGQIPKVIDANIYLVAETFTELQNFINSGSTAIIQLTSDVTKVASEQDQFTNGILIESPITIDGRGNTISANVGKIFTVAEGGSLTIVNTTINSLEGIGSIVNNGEIILDATNPNTYDNVKYVIENNGVVYQQNMANFTHLANLIAVVDGGVINMGASKIRKESSEAAEFEEGIVIDNKIITITDDNFNASIDANDEGSIFKVINNAGLTLENINLTGGHGSIGAAIYVGEDAYLTLNAVNFVDNTAESSNDGVISSEGSVYVENSVFDNNKGNVIVSKNGTLNIITSNFTNNEGSSIISYAAVSILGGYFVNNTASIGTVTVMGDEDSKSSLWMTGVAFINNTNTLAGGAIASRYSELEIVDCTFENNVADVGGAISLLDYVEASISDSSFINNSALGGSAICIYAGDNNVVVDNCVFNENNATFGTVYIFNSTSSATIKNSKFNNNIADNGSAIFNNGILELSNNEITNDQGVFAEIENNGIITSELKAVVLGNKTINILDTDVKLTATLVDDMGNFIKDASFEFTVNGANVPAVYNDTTNLYEANYTLPDLGYYTVSMVSNNGNVDVRTGEFKYIKGSFTDLDRIIQEGVATGYAELLYDFKYNPNVDAGKFPNGIEITGNRNMFIKGNGFTICGDNANRIFTVNGTMFLTIDNVTFCEGKDDIGGAVYVAKNTVFSVRNSRFINNSATFQGGAIYSEGNITVVGSVFDNNDISQCERIEHGGAAIYNNGGALRVESSSFTNNLKDIIVRDGARGDKVSAAIATTGDAIILGSYFANNTGSWGGAIAVISSSDLVKLNVSGTTFEANNATFGGAIYLNNSFATIDDCIFKNNKGLGTTETSNNQGGAVAVDSHSLVAITGSTFIANSATEGGAISLADGNDLQGIDNCNFTDNSAAKGGAVFTSPNTFAQITNSQFSGNTATSAGNAIFNGGLLYLTNNTINADAADIVDDVNGQILSEINIVILNNETVTFNGDVTLTATITDDMGNLIDDKNFKFVVNGTELNATYNPAIGIYDAVYFNDIAGYYYVTMAYVREDNLKIETATLKNIRGTFTDLSGQIATGVQDLPYDFAYVEEIDGDEFVDGILINKNTNIDGNGHTIDAKNANRIFNATAQLTLNNVTLANGAADKGGAIYSTALTSVTDVNFINNTAVRYGGAIYSEGAVYAQNTLFDGNDITARSIDIYGGAAIYNNGGTLNLNNIKVTNNLKGAAVDEDTGYYVGAAIITSGSTLIENSYFANNTAAIGGAILSIDNSYSFTITNTVFEGNNASFGGAVVVAMSNLQVENCSFISNNADTYGGAIAAYLGSIVTITDSKFIENSADAAGAVSLNDVSMGSKISNCEFTDNVARDAGAIYIKSALNNVVTIENSRFDGNMAGNKGASIINNGTLYLSNNTINKNYAEIFNDEGIFVSNVTATFLDNQTVPANMGDTVVLNATFVDDMGNAIYDSKFRFTVIMKNSKEEIENITYNETTALYTVEYYIATAGNKTISTDLSYIAMEKFVGILDVPKANVTLTIFAEDIVEGENATVVVNVYGVKGTLLNTTVKVLVNNTLYPVEVIDSVGTLPVSGLEPGSYAIFVMFEEDDNYNTAYNSSTFYVKYQTHLLVIVGPEYDYGENVTIGFLLLDIQDYTLDFVTAVINVTVNDKSYNVLIDNGVGKLILSDLESGEYKVTSSFEGNTVLNGTTGNEMTFTVKKETVFNVTINGTYPEATIEIRGQNGVYNVYIDDDHEFNVTVDYAPGIETIVLPAGDYEAIVTYLGEDTEYSSASKVVPFTVEKADPQFATEITEDIEVDQEGVQITVTCADNVTGKLMVSIDGVPISQMGYDIIDGCATIPVPYDLLTAGEHSYYITYDGDGNYTASSVYESFIVNKIDPVINITVEEDEIGVMGGPDVTVTVASDATGYLIINYNDEKEIVEYITEGNYTFQIYDLQAGYYFITARYAGDDKYNSAFGYKIFEVPQENVTPVISDVTSDILGGQNVTFVVEMNNTWATGNITIFVDDEEVQTVELDDYASANIVIPGLGNGTHTIGVKYNGDDNFLESDIVNVTVTVTKANSTVTIKPEVNSTYYAFMAIEYTVENETVLIITVVDQDGNPYYGTYFANGIYLLTGLPVGNYTVNATNVETDQFNGAFANTTFSILRSTPIISDVTEDILGGQDATFVVEIDNKLASGNLTIYVDGVPTQIVELKDAKANIAVSGLGNGTHTIGVKYNGNELFYESDVVTTTVNVTKANSTVSIELVVNETYDNYMVIDFDVENETTVIITVKDQDGKIFVGELIDGEYILTDLPIGNYTVNITNVENDMFNGSSANATFAIMKFDFDVDFPVNTSSTTISINGPKDATGLLLVDLNGNQYYADVVNGTASITIPKLAPGDYTATVTYTGDENYGRQTLTKQINVPSNLPENAVTIPEYSETNSPTYSIDLPADATGYFSVVADGKQYAVPLIEGSAKITVPNLAEGDHRVIVSYTGDDKYSSYYNETMLFVHIPVYKLSLNKDVSAWYSSTKSYKVLVTKDDKLMVGQTVTFTFNGKTYKVKTDKNGFATLKLNTKVKVKTYTVTASFKGVTVSNNVKIKNIIKIKNVVAKKTKKVIKIKATLRKVDGKYVKGKTLKLKVKGMTFKAKTNKKGVATFKLNKKAIKKLAKTKTYTYSVTKNMKVSVKKSKYTYAVYYGKDVAKKKITVK